MHALGTSNMASRFFTPGLSVFRRAYHGLSSQTASALSLISSQPSQYVVASVVGRKYLLAPRDVLTVPRLHDVNVGDVITLSEIHELGSREYTLRGSPTLPSEAVKVQATVLEHTKGSLEVMVKKKRRKGYQKMVKHKHPYTRIRIGAISITSPSTPVSTTASS